MMEPSAGRWLRGQPLRASCVPELRMADEPDRLCAGPAVKRGHPHDAGSGISDFAATRIGQRPTRCIRSRSPATLAACAPPMIAGRPGPTRLTFYLDAALARSLAGFEPTAVRAKRAALDEHISRRRKS